MPTLPSHSSPISPSQTALLIQNFSLKSSIQSLHSYCSQLKTQLIQSQFYKTYKQSTSTFHREVYFPFKSAFTKTYQQLPEQLTKLKFQCLNDYTEKQRMIGLNVLAITSALWSVKGYNWNTAYSKTMKALKNATLVYGFAGLIISPEIYNPLMKCKLQ